MSAQLRESGAEVGQRAGEVGAVSARIGGGQLAEQGDRFLGDRQAVGGAAQVRERVAEVGQRAGEVGAVLARIGGRRATRVRSALIGPILRSAETPEWSFCNGLSVRRPMVLISGRMVGLTSGSPHRLSAR